MIIDIRCRLNIKEAGKYFTPQAAGERGHTSAAAVKREPTIEEFFEEIKDAGITTAVCCLGEYPWAPDRRAALFPDRDTPNDVSRGGAKELPREVHRRRRQSTLGMFSITRSRTGTFV